MIKYWKHRIKIEEVNMNLLVPSHSNGLTGSNPSKVPDHVAYGETPNVLDRIHEPRINLAIWHRALPAPLIKWLDALDYKIAKSILYTDIMRVYRGTPDEIWNAILKDMRFRNTDAESLEQLLMDDAMLCAKEFARVIDQKMVLDFRLNGIGWGETKFHIDGPAFRIVTTYRGKGTLWLPSSAANYSALHKTHYTNKDVCRDKSQVQEMGRGDVAIIRGIEPDALVHRSPRVVTKDDFRIVLAINR